MKKHQTHVRKILAKLQEARIPADIDKCKFHMTKTEYLGLMISIDGIKIDPAKIDAIKQWNTPICIQEVCFFIGFCNFYCQFIRNFSKIARPLNTLTKKDVKFAKTNECQAAFQDLKQRVCKSQILIYFNLSKQCHVETDSLDYVSAGILSQEGDNRNLHQIAYFLRRMVSAECNYKINNKELLAII